MVPGKRSKKDKALGKGRGTHARMVIRHKSKKKGKK